MHKIINCGPGARSLIASAAPKSLFAQQINPWTVFGLSSAPIGSFDLSEMYDKAYTGTTTLLRSFESAGNPYPSAVYIDNDRFRCWRTWWTTFAGLPSDTTGFYDSGLTPEEHLDAAIAISVQWLKGVRQAGLDLNHDLRISMWSILNASTRSNEVSAWASDAAAIADLDKIGPVAAEMDFTMPSSYLDGAIALLTDTQVRDRILRAGLSVRTNIPQLPMYGCMRVLYPAGAGGGLGGQAVPLNRWAIHTQAWKDAGATGIAMWENLPTADTANAVNGQAEAVNTIFPNTYLVSRPGASRLRGTTEGTARGLFDVKIIRRR